MKINLSKFYSGLPEGVWKYEHEVFSGNGIKVTLWDQSEYYFYSCSHKNYEEEDTCGTCASNDFIFQMILSQKEEDKPGREYLEEGYIERLLTTDLPLSSQSPSPPPSVYSSC